MKKLHILIVSVDFLPRIGGISTMIHHVANGLVQEGAAVSVLAPKGSSIPGHYQSQYELIVDELAKPALRSGDAAATETVRIETLLYEIFRKNQFSHVFLMHPFYYGEAISKFCNDRRIHLTSFFYGYELNSVISVRPTIRQRIAEALSPNKHSLRFKTKEIIRRSNQVAAISRFTANLVMKADPKASKKILITGCGISLDDYNREMHITPRFVRAERMVRRQNVNLSGGPTVGFTGRLVASKNVGLIIEAISLLDDVSLVIIGDGPQRVALAELASRLGVDSRITWLGSASDELKWKVLRSLDVFILPSTELPDGQVEGFGIVLLEATAAGCPVIAGNSGGMTDVVVDNQNGFLCDTERSADLARKIKILVSRDELSSNFVVDARSQIEQKFNWRVVAKKLIQSVQ